MRRMKDDIEGSISNADHAGVANWATNAAVADWAANISWSGVQDKPSTYAPSAHTHTKSQITDFPTSMPASDVSAWAKAATKPTYTKAEVGLSNVDNTADADKSVKYAIQAAVADRASTGLNGVLTSGTNYVRFGDGTQICWMDSPSTSSSPSTYVEWTFQVPFIDADYCLIPHSYYTVNEYGITKETSKVLCRFSTRLSGYCMVAIGRWR